MKKILSDFLYKDIQFIKGLGPVIACRFDDVIGGRRIIDFLLHKPSYVRKRDILESVNDNMIGETITVPVLIKSQKNGVILRRGRRIPTQITCSDKSGNTIVIQFFNSKFQDYWLQKLPINQWRMISGKLEESGNHYIINHPDFIESLECANKIPDAQIIYPSGEGITQKMFTYVRNQIFNSVPDLSDCDEHICDFFDTLHKIHYATSDDELASASENISKLAYYELLAHQSAIAISRQNRASDKNTRKVREQKCELLSKFYNLIPFQLTGAQQNAVNDIFNDLQKNVPMMRLIQGDVGCGKTMVALCAMLKMAEMGAQSVLLAPTDTLAQQHYAKIKPICESLGLVCDILTGRDKGALRREKIISLRSGRTKIAIGTHALFSDDVVYKDMGLVVIDEQHRFGVAQRQALRDKGNNPDVLALSATPIPRTLSMTVYGDMDISIIAEKPAGRLPIITTKLPMFRINDLIERLKIQMNTGGKIFWVCPLVQESDVNTLTSVTERYELLKQHFENVGLVHGQMLKTERDTIMTEFADSKSNMRVLVATSVIEVGIDVPMANVIVIENAERFGLAALHQLRGRVGRGNLQSYCVLLYGNNITPDGLKRLNVLTETNDGFVIAEQDLMMRGVGELLGTKQSGWINYHFVDYREHRNLFKQATMDAKHINLSAEWLMDLMNIFNVGVKLGA